MGPQRSSMRSSTQKNNENKLLLTMYFMLFPRTTSSIYIVPLLIPHQPLRAGTHYPHLTHELLSIKSNVTHWGRSSIYICTLVYRALNHCHLYIVPASPTNEPTWTSRLQIPSETLFWLELAIAVHGKPCIITENIASTCTTSPIQQLLLNLYVKS